MPSHMILASLTQGAGSGEEGSREGGGQRVLLSFHVFPEHIMDAASHHVSTGETAFRDWPARCRFVIGRPDPAL